MMQRINNYQEIDLDYLTCAEYQLFLDEKCLQGEYYHPDYWVSDTFPKGSANAPICGMCAEDAQEFCRWLTRREGDPWNYRLPTAKEARLHPPVVDRNDLATWCREKDSYRLVGHLVETEQRYIEQWKAISNSLGENFAAMPHCNPARALTLVFSRTLELPIVLMHNNDLELVSALVHTLDAKRARELAHIRHLAHNKTFVHDLVHTLHRIRHIDTQFFDSKIAPISKAIDNGDFNTAMQWAQNIQETHTAPGWKHFGMLLYELLICTTITNPIEAWKAWRKYVIKVTKSILMTYKKIEGKKRSEKFEQHFERNKKILLNLYVWLHMVEAKEEKKWSVWEGIRIVRERKNNQ